MSEMQNAAQSAAPTSKEFRITMVIVICATLIGASGGILIASREAQLGRSEVFVRPGVEQSAAQALARKNEPQKTELATTDAREAPEAAAWTPSNPGLPLSSLVGRIDCSHQQDEATVDIEVGTVTVVRVEQLHNPERIFFDLQESNHSGSSMGTFLGKKTVRLKDPLVAGVRVSFWNSGTARVVLDLKRSCRYSYQLSPDPSPRLLIQIRESEHRATAATK